MLDLKAWPWQPWPHDIDVHTNVILRKYQETKGNNQTKHLKGNWVETQNISKTILELSK